MTNKIEQDAVGIWHLTAEEQLKKLGVTQEGLSSLEANQRINRYGKNRINQNHQHGKVRLFLNQFNNSIILILLFATGLSLYLGEHIDAAIILTIVLVSGCLGFWQEKGATDAIKQLLTLVQTKVNVLRDGGLVDTPTENIVPGDIILLRPGDIIAADCLVLAADNLFIDEAALTGESYPVEKNPGVLPLATALTQRTNTLWMGTHVQSGTGKALAITTGVNTEFGRLSKRIALKAPETEFERGIRQFGHLLTEVTLVLVILIFAVNVYLHKPVVDSFLFALALAVGLTPQLLPAVISVNLSYGAKRMAEHKVVVKQLSAIENFGSMQVLCSDKTGTLTEGTVKLHGAFDVSGNRCEKTALYAYINSRFESGFLNPIDEAIRGAIQQNISNYAKLAEIPYDFYRKRLSLLVADKNSKLLITKGALDNVLAVCTEAELNNAVIVNIEEVRSQIRQQYEQYSQQGFRTLGLAYKPLDEQINQDKAEESGMRFLGFLTFFDPPKADCTATIAQLRNLGVTLKIITGDNHLVAATISRQLGLAEARILTGSELANMSSMSLMNKATEVDIFAEVEPNQKERIILALKKAGYVVGYMGDGINDVSALHAADVGISVNSAADVAKETAQIVLLEHDLGVLTQGIQVGRTTFANTLKYVFMATSANFGNMFSMAGVSLFLSFLPLLPKQILLTNLLTDFPEMTIASDSVDSEWVATPRRWDVNFIRKFMMTFGFVSSFFDFATFGLLLLLNSSESQFRTGWFLESVISAAMIVLVVRTRRPLFKSRPGNYLVMATFSIVILTAFLPYTPIAPYAGFVPLPVDVLGMLIVIVVLYILTAEIAKYFFYRRVKI